MEYIIMFALGWFIGRFVYKFMLIKEAIKSMSQSELSQYKRLHEPEEMPALHTESIDGTMLLYDTPSSMYLCCGKTIEELAENLNSFCHINSANITHDNQQILVVDGKVA